jgi:hypothetical protein
MTTRGRKNTKRGHRKGLSGEDVRRLVELLSDGRWRACERWIACVTRVNERRGLALCYVFLDFAEMDADSKWHPSGALH